MVKAGKIGIRPFDEDNVQPSSYDLGLWHEALQNGSKLEVTESGIWIEPHKLILLSSLEYVELPLNIVARIYIRSSLAREGLFPEGQGRVEAGYRGTLTLPVINLGRKPIHLSRNERFATIEFCYLNQSVSSGYTGKYQGSKGPVPSYRTQVSGQ